MRQGTVEWYNDSRGFGFIVQDDGLYIFVHYLAIEAEFRSLAEGQRVEFDVVEGTKGLSAANVRKVGQHCMAADRCMSPVNG